METSAKTGHAVEEAFLKCSKNILAKIETGELDPERIGSGKSTGRLLICIISKDQQNRNLGNEQRVLRLPKTYTYSMKV